MDYFVISSVAVFFGIMQETVVDGCFLFFVRFEFEMIHVIMAFINACYQVFSIRKMKAHVKELDRLVTIRFDEVENYKAEHSIHKMERTI